MNVYLLWKGYVVSLIRNDEINTIIIYVMALRGDTDVRNELAVAKLRKYKSPIHAYKSHLYGRCYEGQTYGIGQPKQFCEKQEVSNLSKYWTA